MVSRKVFVLVAGLVCMFAVPAVAQECPQLVDQIVWSSQAHQVAASGDYVYIGTDGGVIAVRFLGPGEQEVVGGVGLPEIAQDIEVSSGYVYVAAGEAGLRVIDVRDPSSPVEVGYFEPSEGAFSQIAVFGRTVYVIDPVSGLHLIDVQDPYSPYEVGWIGSQGSIYEDVTAFGDYAYLTATTFDPATKGIISVVDVSTPSSPFEVGSYSHPTTFSFGNIAVSGGFAYTSGGWIWGVVDIRVPSSPAGGWFEIDQRAYFSNIVASGHLVFRISNFLWGNPNDGNRFGVFDATSPTSPSYLGSGGDIYEVFFNDLAVSGRYAFLTAGEDGVYVYDTIGCLPSGPDAVAFPHVD